MNNRIDIMFKEKKKENKKALITFVTAGDPDLKTTYDLVLAMEQNGADLIELGIPFSDPVAEGAVIQQANVRALKNNVKTDEVFALVKSLRKETTIPIVFLMYANSIFRYGKEAFFKQCSDCGVDGVILPDLPYEEKDEFAETAEEQSVYIISLVAPTSLVRIKAIAESAKGFLYCVSSLGVTGVRSNFNTDFETFFKEIYNHSQIPAVIGFGISGPEAVKELKGYCDGVIVGSAIVKLIGSSQTPTEATQKVSAFTKSLKEALI